MELFHHFVSNGDGQTKRDKRSEICTTSRNFADFLLRPWKVQLLGGFQSIFGRFWVVFCQFWLKMTKNRPKIDSVDLLQGVRWGGVLLKRERVCASVAEREVSRVAFMTVLAVLTGGVWRFVLESTLPFFHLSYKIQHNEGTMTVLTVLTVSAVMAV